MKKSDMALLAGLAAGVCLVVAVQVLDWWTGSLTFGVPISFTYKLEGFRLCAENQCTTIAALGTLSVVSPLTLWGGTALGVLTIGSSLAPLVGVTLPRWVVLRTLHAAVAVTLLVFWICMMVPPISGIFSTFALPLDGARSIGCLAGVAGAVGVAAASYWRLQVDGDGVATTPMVSTPAPGRYARPTANPPSSAPAAPSAEPAAPVRRVAKHIEPIELDLGPADADRDAPPDPFGPPR